MKIFIGGLSANDTQRSLQRLVDGLTKEPWYKLFAARTQLVGCFVYQMTDMDTGRVEFSATLELSSTRAAWALIAKLNGLQHKGRTLRSHKWFTRRNMADRRVLYLDENTASETQYNRRSGRDRRRNLKIQSPQRIRTTGLDNFQRSYGT